MIWNLLPLVVHLLGTSGMHINRWVQAHRLRRRRRVEVEYDTEQATPLTTLSTAHKHSDSAVDTKNGNTIVLRAERPRSTLKPMGFKRILAWMKLQVLTSVAHPAIPRALRPDEAYDHHA